MAGMARLVAILLLLAPFARAQEDYLGHADALVKPFVDSDAFVGMALGMVAPGGTVFMKGYGRVTKDKANLPDADTVYEIGSISKVFTGSLLASLVLAGTVKLDQPVQELLPDANVPAYGERRIRLIDLATQSSGLPRMPNNFRPKNPANPYADYTVAQAYQFLAGHKLARAPGKAYGYSNLGVGLLGHALALKNGADYESLLVRLIAGPLKMADTRVAFTDAMRKRLAPGHNVLLTETPNWDIVTFAGAGGIRSTVRDMVNFLQANLGNDPALALARKQHFGRGRKMGLGWHIGGGGARWHNGQTGGYHSYCAIDTRHKTALVILSNTATGDVDRLGNQILRMLNGAEVEPARFDLDAKILKPYVGRYDLMAGVVMEVTRDGGALMVQLTGQPRLRVFPRSETEFYYRVVAARISFQKDDKGRITGLTLQQAGRTLTAKRQ